MIEFKLLLLVLTANGAPILANDVLRTRFSRPLDFGCTFFDGEPLFGEAKTWRGLFSAAVLTPLAAWLIGLDWDTGLAVAAGAMGGDLLSSFVKRRLRRPVSSMALGLDQIPESLFAVLAVRTRYALDVLDVVALAGAFVVIELLLSRLLYRFNLRKQPY